MKIPNDLFSRSLKIVSLPFHLSKFLMTFFLVICSIFTFQPLTNHCRYNIQSTFSQHFSVFTPLFHSRTSKFTTTTAQLPFYNCKLHFTTAEIVISCTLKYALLETRARTCLYYIGCRGVHLP